MEVLMFKKAVAFIMVFISLTLLFVSCDPIIDNGNESTKSYGEMSRG